MVAQSLQQDGSRSLQRCQGRFNLTWPETFPVQDKRKTKAALEVGFDFLSCLVD